MPSIPRRRCTRCIVQRKNCDTAKPKCGSCAKVESFAVKCTYPEDFTSPPSRKDYLRRQSEAVTEVGGAIEPGKRNCWRETKQEQPLQPLPIMVKESDRFFSPPSQRSRKFANQTQQTAIPSTSPILPPPNMSPYLRGGDASDSFFAGTHASRSSAEAGHQTARRASPRSTDLMHDQESQYVPSAYSRVSESNPYRRRTGYETQQVPSQQPQSTSQPKLLQDVNNFPQTEYRSRRGLEYLNRAQTAAIDQAGGSRTFARLSPNDAGEFHPHRLDNDRDGDVRSRSPPGGANTGMYFNKYQRAYQALTMPSMEVTPEVIGRNLANTIYHNQPRHRGGVLAGLPDWTEHVKSPSYVEPLSEEEIKKKEQGLDDFLGRLPQLMDQYRRR